MVVKSNSVLMAERDGIEFILDENARANKSKYIFFIPCGKCGEKISAKVYQREKNYVCEYCKRELEKKHKAERQLAIDSFYTKGEQRLMKAYEEMSKQIPNFYEDYKKCMDVIESRKETFDSIPEIMVALQLLKIGKKIIIHQKVRTYTVDLMIPDDKLIIEVDGKLYHSRGTDEVRDEVIKYALGHDWKIIHVPAELIRLQIKSLETIVKKALT